MRFLDIHDLVTNIVGHLDEKNQQMEYILQGMFTELTDSQFFGYLLENFFFTLKKAVLKPLGVSFVDSKGYLTMEAKVV